MTHVIFHGPQASGKTKNQAAVAKFFGIKNIVEGPYNPALKDRTLFVTNVFCFEADYPEAEVYSVPQMKRLLKDDWK